MARTSLVWISLGLAAGAFGCRQPEEGIFEFTEVTTTGGPLETESESESESGTETGEEVPEVYEGLRFVAAGSDPAVILALDLDDPQSIPEAETILSGVQYAGVFGPTPWDSQIVTHDGAIDQLRLSGSGEFSLSPLAVVPANWLDSAWFDDAGNNALMSVGNAPGAAPNKLFWLRYENELLNGTLNITPPIEENGMVITLGRTPDNSTSVVLVDAEGNDTWQIYVLPLEPELAMAQQINQATLPGIPGQNVPAFLWAHIDDERVVFRKELLPNTLRPAAVPIADPAAPVVNLAPDLGAVSSMIWNQSNDAMLVTSEGGGSFRQLDLIQMVGPTDALPPIAITQPDQLALNVVRPPLGPLVQGHGFDAMGRIFFGYTLSGDAVEGIELITIAAGNIAGRQDIDGAPPAVEIQNLVFDETTQLLGYRVVSGNASWVSYLDLDDQNPEAIRVDQFFDHDDLNPDDFVHYAFSRDGSQMAIVGAQSGTSILHMVTIGDELGETVAVDLPTVEMTQGVTIDHEPFLSPDGLHVLMWYGATNDRRGLIQAPSDGSRSGEAVINLQYALSTGAFIPNGL